VAPKSEKNHSTHSASLSRKKQRSKISAKGLDQKCIFKLKFSVFI
jgi:hypothetical protein